MRYWYPFTEEALEKIKADNVTRLVVLPLYPQFSISTSGSSLRLLEEVGLVSSSEQAQIFGGPTPKLTVLLVSHMSCTAAAMLLLLSV